MRRIKVFQGSDADMVAIDISQRLRDEEIIQIIPAPVGYRHYVWVLYEKKEVKKVSDYILEERIKAKLELLEKEYEKYKAMEDYEAIVEILSAIDLLKELLEGE